MRTSQLRTSVATILLLFLITACGPQATPTPEPPGIVLSFFGANGPEYLTLQDLEGLPLTEGYAGIKSSTGQITIPELYRGVAIRDILAAFDSEIDDSQGVILTAEDGYSMTLSFDQVMNGDFIAYDPALGNELADHDPLTAILAYEKNGELLDPIQDGTLRLMVVSEVNNQVVDGHWTVKWINKIEVESISATWTLDLRGAIITPVDRASFQSCGAPGCHGVDWQDENGQTWTGVPLWLLVGQVDDADSHSDYAYNDALAQAGYTVDLIAADGYTISLDSVSIEMNGDILVAHLVNNSELPERYYPLRLVGANLENSQQIGQIVSIVVHVPEAPAATQAPAVDLTGDLLITGLVTQPIGLTEADLRGSGLAVEITAEHPKNGLQTFSGIPFRCLFTDLAGGLDPGASTVLLTASDGYSMEIPLAELNACQDCMLAFTETPGVFNAVMPGMISGNWVKQVVSIEVR